MPGLRAVPCRAVPSVPAPASRGREQSARGRQGWRRAEAGAGAAAGLSPTELPSLCCPRRLWATCSPRTWWGMVASPWGHSPFPRVHRGPSSMGTVSPRPWRPHPSARGDRGHTQPLTHGLCPPARGDRGPSATRVTAPIPGARGPSAAPGQRPSPAGSRGPTVPAALSRWPPALRDNPEDKGGHCHLEASPGIVSPNPRPPRVWHSRGTAGSGVPVIFGGCPSPWARQSRAEGQGL